MPVILKHCVNEDHELRQSAAFGLGACAEAMGRAFGNAREKVLTVLFQVATAEGTREGENEPASDCAISAVGKLCRFCYQEGEEPIFRGEKVLPRWLSWLPIKADEEEAVLNNARLLDFVEQNNPFLLGDNNANLPKVS